MAMCSDEGQEKGHISGTSQLLHSGQPGGTRIMIQSQIFWRGEAYVILSLGGNDEKYYGESLVYMESVSLHGELVRGCHSIN